MRIKWLFIFFALLCYSFATAQPPKSIEQLRAQLSIKKDTAYANALFNIAAYYRVQDETDSTMVYFKQCIEFSEKINFYQGQCKSTWGLADAYMRKDATDTALNLLISALKIAEKIKPESERPYYELKILQRLDGIYLTLEDYENGARYLAQAEKIAMQQKDTMSLIPICRDYSYCLALTRDSVAAAAYYKKGWALCNIYEKAHPNEKAKLISINGFRVDLVRSFLGIFKAPELEREALVALEKAWEVREEAGERNRNALLISMTKLYQLTGNYKKAIEFGDIILSDSATFSNAFIDIYPVMAYAYQGLGDYQNAYEYFYRYMGEYQAAFETDRIAALTSVEKKYQTEQKEQQILTLNEEKKSQRVITFISIGALVIALGLLIVVLRAKRLQQKLFTKEKELQKREMEKRMYDLEQTALRAQMNPHFIFNSLNSVQRFVINNDVEGVNQYLATFANLIRQTLENSGKSLIPLKDELRYLDTYLRLEQMRGNDKFKYLINVNEDIDTEETYIPNMIIQPYLENSIIHGMAGKTANEGIINLTISKNHKLTCIVDDNGAGIAATKTYRKTIETGHESMGTTITEKRIEMFNTVNQEKIELEVLDKSVLHNNESGTRIMIKFPLNPTAN